MAYWKPMDQEFVDFFEFHFKPARGFYSYIICGCKNNNVIIPEEGEDGVVKWKKPRARMYNCFYIKTDEIGRGNRAMRQLWMSMTNRGFEYFITNNGFSNPKKRDSNHVFTYSNIVIDIDCHDRYVSERAMNRTIDQLEACLYDTFDGHDGMMPPNTVVRTGHGVQLWWAVEPIPAKFRYIYDSIRTRISDACAKMVDDYECFDIFQVDKAASGNYAGFFRLPGSLNKGRKVTYEKLHRRRMDLFCLFFDGREAGESAGDAPVPTRRQIRKNKRNAKKASHESRRHMSSLVAVRERMLHGLVKLRKKKVRGSRDVMILVLYSAYMSTGSSAAAAMEAALKLNREFLEPLAPRKISEYMRTCTRKKYKYSNARIIEILGMSKAECRKLGFFPAKNRKEEYDLKRTRKAKRDEQVRDLLKKGMSQQEIAKLTGCSQPTVCRIKKAMEQASAAAA